MLPLTYIIQQTRLGNERCQNKGHREVLQQSQPVSQAVSCMPTFKNNFNTTF